MSEFRLALRRLLRTPFFTLTALLVLAVGIGVNVYLVSAVRAGLDRSLTFQQPDRVVYIRPGGPREGMNWRPLAGIQFRELQLQAKALDAWVAVRDSQALLQGEGEPERIGVGLVTGDGLAGLGVPFALGRDLADPDGVVLSHGTWVRRYGQDPGIVGRSLWIGNRARKVTGVLGPQVRLPWMLADKEVFLPLIFRGGEATEREVTSCWVLARLAPGKTLNAARMELSHLGPAVATAAQRSEGWRLDAETIAGEARRQTLESLQILGLLSLFLLLLVCANVAGMHLARLAERAREAALRSALGATRSELLRVLGVESLLLSLGGACLGTVGLWLLMRKEMNGALKLDSALLTTVLLLALLAALVSGLAPAWLGSRTDLRTLLNQGASGTLGGGRLRWRKALVVAQVGLTTLLLSGAGLAGQALRRMQHLDMGLRPDGLVGLEISTRKGAALDVRALQQSLLAVPGVRGAALASEMPLYHRSDEAPIWADQGALPHGQASSQQVSDTYFNTLQIALKAGRTFEGIGVGECLVSESAARRYWPGRSALGQRLRLGFEQAPWLSVVGVVADHRHNGLDRAPVDQVFTSYAAVFNTVHGALLVRVDGDAAAVGPALQKALKDLHPGLDVHRVVSLRELVDEALEGPRSQQSMLLMGGVLAALLAGLGLHATARSLAVQRTREFGLRLALGSTRRRLLGVALGESFRQAGYGFLAGQAGAFGLVLLMGSSFQGVRVLDLPSLVAVTAALGAMTLLASLLPAVRAARIQPAEALRSE